MLALFAKKLALHERFESIINYLAITAVLIGITGILGWVLNIPVLYMFLSNGASMKFITAFSTVLIGAALFSVLKGKTIFTQLLASVALLIGIATIAEYLFNTDLKVDITFAGNNAGNLPDEAPGRMSLYTAILFTLISIGVFLFTIKKFFVGQCIIVLGILMTYSTLLGILFNIGHLFTFGYFSAVSFPAAVGLLATSLGLLLYSADEGWLHEAFTGHSAAQTVRYAILYFFIVTPVFLGIFLLALNYTDFPPEFTLVILIIGTTACTLPLVYKLLKKMNHDDNGLHQLTRKLKRRTRELTDKNEALSRMNKDLDNIIHIISHDLKTPITSLQTSLDILEMALGDAANGSLHNLIGVPKRSVNQLKEIIENLRETVKALRPEQPQLEEIDIGAMIDEIKGTDLQTVIQNTGATIHVYTDDYILIYERIHVRSILQNLISSALKYHQHNRPPVLYISSKKVEGGIQLSVQDNGLIISEEEKQHLFGKYKRLHQRGEGAGVGLYLIRRLLEARGGHIEVVSKEGEGTTFNVFFPFVRLETSYHINSINASNN
jgi:signal transduction histidine kinase